jgi:hypothetical protein
LAAAVDDMEMETIEELFQQECIQQADNMFKNIDALIASLQMANSEDNEKDKEDEQK